jgi:class 3 adenylate cyclase
MESTTPDEAKNVAILMLDVHGYSKLSPWCLKKFFSLVLPKINELLGRTCYKNSWGDGVIAVYDTELRHARAGEAGLSIAAWFNQTDWPKELNDTGSPQLQVRISLHSGQLIFGEDPIQGDRGCFGQPIHVCARLEPIVEPNQVWCTDTYATQLRDELNYEHRTLGLYSIGSHRLAKDYGDQPFRLFELVNKVQRGIVEKEVILGEHPTRVESVRDTNELVPQSRVAEMTVEQLYEVVNDAVHGPIGDLRRQLAPHLTGSNGVFGERSDHFKDEKTAIARYWLDHIRKQIDASPNCGQKKYRLFLDSGTTVFAVFEQLIYDNSNWNFFRNLPFEIITNNVPGFMLTLDDTLIKNDRNTLGEGLARRFKILPGAPVARYRAIISEETIDYLRDRYPRKIDFHNIVVTTGNFARQDGRGIYARDKYHFQFKEELIKLADEVWTLLPLGKILPAAWDRERLNTYAVEDKLAEDYYDLVEIPDDKPHRIVTTSRSTKNRLYNHYVNFRQSTQRLSARADGRLQYHFVPCENKDCTDIAFDIGQVSTRWNKTELALEFPHAWMTQDDVRDELLASYGALIHDHQ